MNKIKLSQGIAQITQTLGCMGMLTACSELYTKQDMRPTEIVQNQIKEDLDLYCKKIDQQDPIVKQWSKDGKMYYVHTNNDTAFEGKPKSNLFVHNVVYDAVQKVDIDQSLKEAIARDLQRSFAEKNRFGPG